MPGLAFFKVKNQLTFHKVRWLSIVFVSHYIIRCFKRWMMNLMNFHSSANIFWHIPLKMGNKMKKILSPAYSLKLKDIILFLTWDFFFKWSYSQRCFDVPSVVKINIENDNIVLTFCLYQRCLYQRWNRQRWFDVVQRCEFQRTKSCFNVDLTLCDVATSYQPKNNVETTLKCLLGKVLLFSC